MECEDIYNAARDGDLYRLVTFLHSKPKEEVARLVSSRTNAATPLTVACKNGHLAVVKYLLRECYADVEQVGMEEILPREAVYDASPLWHACAFGHLNIIETLLEHNASVNGGTNTNSIPLHIACLKGNFEIAEYLINHGADIENKDSNGCTCLMIACLNRHHKLSKYLVESGADVNEKCNDGRTALHESATSGCLKSFKMLLKYGAGMYTDKWGVTPLLYATNRSQHKIMCYCFNKFKFSKQDKLDATELLGVTYVLREQDTEGLYFWKRAIEFRYENSASVLEKPKDKSSFLFCVGKTEVSTSDEIEELIADRDEIKMQALLISLRILGESHPLVLTDLKRLGEYYACKGNFERCIQLFMFVLDTEQRVQPPLSSKTVDAFITIVHLFCSRTWDFPESASVQHILPLLKKVLGEIERALNKYSNFKTNTSLAHRYNLTRRFALYFLNIKCIEFCNLMSPLNAKEELSLMKAAHRLATMNPGTADGATCLHLALSRIPQHWNPRIKSPSVEMIHLLLEVGACPNALNWSNNTPLHFAAMARPFDANVFQLLLNLGAHLDFRNKRNETPLQLVPDASVLNINPLRYTNLQCLCAQAIHVHKIPFEGFIHKELYEFVHLH